MPECISRSERSYLDHLLYIYMFCWSRNQGLSLAAVSGRIGGVLSPQIVFLASIPRGHVYCMGRSMLGFASFNILIA